MGQWTTTFAEKICWWEELDYSLGEWLFACMLSKPCLCSCFVMACLSFPSPCMWCPSKENQVGRAVWASQDRTCIPVLSIICWRTLEGFPLSPVMGSANHPWDVPSPLHCLHAAAVHSPWMLSSISKQNPMPLICLLCESWVRVMFIWLSFGIWIPLGSLKCLISIAQMFLQLPIEPQDYNKTWNWAIYLQVLKIIQKIIFSSEMHPPGAQKVLAFHFTLKEELNFIIC